MSNQWTLRKEKTSIEVKYLPAIPVTSHPLANNVRPQRKDHSEKIQPKLQFIDPLSIALDGTDPLTVGFSKNESLSHAKLQEEENLSYEAKNFKSWEQICSHYFARCNTKQRISTSFSLNSELGVPNFETIGCNTVKGSTHTESERIRLRLEYLNSMEKTNSSRDLTSLTQEQFSEYISFLKSELLSVWKSEHRVRALRIAKECSKSLGLSTPELFYPQKFTLVTDLLLTLSGLVYERLNELAKSQDSAGNALEVKEVARNWFSNIASMRDLLPRIYLETTLMQCYTFSDIDTIECAFERLLRMTRGLADPLVSAYAKMYVVKMALGGNRMNHLTATVCDIKETLQWGWGDQGIESIEFSNEACSSGKEIAEKIFYPPLLWILQCLVNYCCISDYKTVYDTCLKSEKLVQFLLLKAAFATFPASFIASECIAFSDLISQCLQHGTNPQDLLISYGQVMNLAAVPKGYKFELMSGIWNLLCTLDSLGIFIKASDPWMQFAAQNFEVNDIEKILSNLVKKILSLSEEHPKLYHSELLHLVVNILRNAKQPELLLLRPNLQQLLIMLQRDVVGFQLACKEGKTRLGLSELKELLEAVISHHPSALRNPSLIKILIELFSSLHDRINALTTNDEKRQITQLLRDFILKVDFGRDFTRQLEFYVSCRASFVNLDSILEILIHQVCKLQMDTLVIMKRKHSSKTASFERACTAYCFITIPSMTSSHKRLQLYLLAGYVAMVNSCVNQAQTCIESAIQEVSKCVEALSTESLPPDLLSTLLCLCSCLISTPCLSDSSLRWFVNVTQAVEMLSNNVDLTANLELAVFKAVCVSSRKCLPYHYSGVSGNDSIFSHERRHFEAVDMCYKRLPHIISVVTSTNSDVYNSMKTELLDCLLQYGDNKENTRTLSLILKSLTKHNDKCYYEKRIKNLMQL